MTDGLPEKTSEAADWGTCCHEIAEHCIRDGKQAIDFLATPIKGKQYEFEVDEEMADTAQVYVDYVRQRAIEAAPKNVSPSTMMHIEQKFSLMSLNPPFDAGGIADCVIHFPAEKLLEVIDLKGGRGYVVEAEGNPQLRTYALGAMLANPGLPVQQIKVTIVQPRAPHKDGRIRSDTFHVADLIEWTADLVRAMQRAKDAMLFRATDNSTVWEKKYLAAGDHCTFCKAKGFCPALERRAHDAVGLWFDDLDQPQIAAGNQPDMLSPERAAQLLDAADVIGEYINAVRAYWHAQAEMGVEIPGYILVEKHGHCKWDAGEATVVSELEALGADPWAKKLVTPAVAERLVGSKNKVKIASLIVKPVTGTNLTRADKTSRKPAEPKVQKFFSVLD